MKSFRPAVFSLLCFLCLFVATLPRAAGLDELKVKREALFEFAQKPRVTRSGDRVEISFESKGACDVTLAIEDGQGLIVRHLCSGVLGPNAPEPLQKNSLRQCVVWDGKDDRGRYVEHKETLSVRVSLGLAPRLERSLLWSPQKRGWSPPPLICASEEGVFVFEGMGADHLRLFDHAGNYVRTVYPFPADRIGAVLGLGWRTFAPDGAKLPEKLGKYEDTLLPSGDNARGRLDNRGKPPNYGLSGRAASALAVGKGRVALAHYGLSRLATDGSSGGVSLKGPDVVVPQIYGTGDRPRTMDVMPKSAAFSPDGKWLYLAGYTWDRILDDAWHQHWHCMHGVYRVAYDGQTPPELFAGSAKVQEFGSDSTRFKCATSVACDPQGRVYVADYMNDRVQVFTPEGKFLKTIPVYKPAWVFVHQRTNEIYVFSWLLVNQFLIENSDPNTVKPTLTRFGPVENPVKLASVPLPLHVGERPSGGRGAALGHHARVALDSWSDPPIIWLAPAHGSAGIQMAVVQDHEIKRALATQGWEQMGIRLLTEKNGALELKRDFGKEAREHMAKLSPASFSRQRLYVNPKTRLLYAADEVDFTKYISLLQEIDPETGKSRVIQLPYPCEDFAFGLDGLLYLRTKTLVGRFDPATWREVPWDYGEELDLPASSGEGKYRLLSALPLHSATSWHHGGMGVSPLGHLVVACTSSTKNLEIRTDEKGAQSAGKPYVPRLYPGRFLWYKTAILHIWDKHGKMLYEDAVPGLNNLNGVFLDKDDDLYVLNAAVRLDAQGQPACDRTSEVLVKFPPKGARIISSSSHVPLPLLEAERPKRAPPWSAFWPEGAQWMYGGVGFEGMNVKDGLCSCSNSRFALDYFARSFAPELGRCGIAVLDKNGNLILRVGQYGNADDGLPLVKDGGPPNPRSIGGDEVSLFYAPYVATHTDRRLFISDPGNARIVSVKLGYHAEERVLLKDVPNAAAK